MANEKIKVKAKQNKVYLWEVADRLGMQDSALSRKLRKELPPEEANRILDAISQIAVEREVV